MAMRVPITVTSASTGSNKFNCLTTIESSSTSITFVTYRKVGIYYFYKLCNKSYCPIVNIDKLWSLVPNEVKEKASKENVPFIDITQYGYFKAFRKGVLPEDQPGVVKAKLVSKHAERKIKEVGGAVVFTA